MTVDQAKDGAKQLNAKLHLKRREELHLAYEKQANELQNKFQAAIPELYKQEFEQKYVYGRFNDPEWRKRFFRTWRAVQKLLIEVQLDPCDRYDMMKCLSSMINFIESSTVIYGVISSQEKYANLL